MIQELTGKWYLKHVWFGMCYVVMAQVKEKYISPPIDQLAERYYYRKALPEDLIELKLTCV